MKGPHAVYTVRERCRKDLACVFPLKVVYKLLKVIIKTCSATNRCLKPAIGVNHRSCLWSSIIRSLNAKCFPPQKKT